MASIFFSRVYDEAFGLLVEARDYVARARAFFVDGSEYQTGRCDELIARIDAAEAGS